MIETTQLDEMETTDMSVIAPLDMDLISRMTPEMELHGVTVKPLALKRIKRVSAVMRAFLVDVREDGIQPHVIGHLINSLQYINDLRRTRKLQAADGTVRELSEAEVNELIMATITETLGGAIDAASLFSLVVEHLGDFIVACTDADPAVVDEYEPNQAIEVALLVFKANGERLKNLFGPLLENMAAGPQAQSKGQQSDTKKRKRT